MSQKGKANVVFVVCFFSCVQNSVKISGEDCGPMRRVLNCLNLPRGSMDLLIVFPSDQRGGNSTSIWLYMYYSKSAFCNNAITQWWIFRHVKKRTNNEFAIWISLWDIDIVWSRLLTAPSKYKSHYRVVVKSSASGQCGPGSIPGSEQKMEWP